MVNCTPLTGTLLVRSTPATLSELATIFRVDSSSFSIAGVWDAFSTFFPASVFAAS